MAESLKQLIASSGLPKESQSLKKAQQNFRDAWNEMLEVAAIDQQDRDTPLTEEIFDDPTHKIVSTLLAIFCQEGFVYKILNHALRPKDQSKVDTLGPYAHSLNMIVAHTAQNREDIDTKMFNDRDEPLELYRGACQTEEQIQEYIDAIGKTRMFRGRE